MFVVVWAVAPVAVVWLETSLSKKLFVKVPEPEPIKPLSVGFASPS